MSKYMFFILTAFQYYEKIILQVYWGGNIPIYYQHLNNIYSIHHQSSVAVSIMSGAQLSES